MQPEDPERETASLGDSFHQILKAAQAGGEWAWREIYWSLSPVVLGYVRARGAQDPEDLVGEVFLHVVQGIRSFSGNQNALRAWVLTIARRRVIDEQRRRGRRPKSGAEPRDLEALGPLGDAEREAVASLEASRTVQAIRELTAGQQDVLLLRLVGDLSLEEVARVLGKRLTAVKALQRRGLASLAQKISKEAVSI
jgi:RNA polymerase sigma-70 factor (ECF subfamily)